MIKRKQNTTTRHPPTKSYGRLEGLFIKIKKRKKEKKNEEEV